MPGVAKRAKQQQLTAKSRPQWHWWACLLALPVLVILLYSNAERAPFVFDDRIHILDNPYVRAFRSTLDSEAISKLIHNPSGLASRPLLLATYGWNFASTGMDAGAFRRINWLIHAVNALLVFLIAFEIAANAGAAGRRFQAALFSGALFAAHPLLTESVTYVSGRSSSLCATFYFMGLFAVLRAGRSKSLRWPLLAALIVCTLIGLLVKQEAITLPAAGVVLIWLAWPETETIRRRLTATSTLALGTVLILAIQYRPLADTSATTQNNWELLAAGFESTLAFFPYFLTAITAYCSYYLWRFVLPVNLSLDPEIATVSTPLSAPFLISVIVLCALVYAAFCLHKSRTMLVCGIGLILVSPLSAYCVFPLADVVAEHRAYISVLGLVLVLADLIVSLPGAARISVWLCLIGLYGWLTIERNAVWNSEIALWQDASQKAPEKVRPHLNLGALYQISGQRDQAIREYEFVLQRDSNHSAAVSNLGALYLEVQEPGKAEELLVRAVEQKSVYPNVYLNLGVLRLRQGRYDEARDLLRQALKFNPRQAMAHLNLGDILFNQGRPADAIKEYLEEIEVNPDFALTHLHLAQAQEAMERLK